MLSNATNAKPQKGKKMDYTPNNPKILMLDSSQELKTTKNMMCKSLIVATISLFALMIPFVNLLALIVFVAASICYLVGVYHFSKLTHSSVFAYMIYMLICVFVLPLIPIFWIAAYQSITLDSTIIISVVVGLVLVAINVFLFYRICKAMESITCLSHFMLAFKCYIGSVIISLIGLLYLWFNIDMQEFIALYTSGNEMSIFTEKSYQQGGMNDGFIGVSGYMIATFLSALISLASMVFWILGHIRIQEVKVQENLKDNLKN